MMNSRRASTSSPMSTREQLVGLGGVVERDLEQQPGLRVHRGLPELGGVHLAETLEPLHAVVEPRVALALRDARLDDRVTLPVASRRSRGVVALAGPT